MKKLFKPLSMMALVLVIAFGFACGNTGTDQRFSDLFTISYTYPEGFANEVGLDEVVAITFTQPIDRSSVYYQSVTVEALPNSTTIEGTPVNANVIVGDDYTLNVALPGGWQSNTTYVLTVSPNIQSTGGNILGAPFALRFSTGVNWGSVPGKPIVDKVEVLTDRIVYYPPAGIHVIENMVFQVYFNEDIVTPPVAMLTVEICEWVLGTEYCSSEMGFSSMEVQYSYPDSSLQNFTIFFPYVEPATMIGCYNDMYVATVPFVSQLKLQLFNAIDKENYRMDPVTKTYRMFEDYLTPAGCTSFM